jgi:hypothetical protein
MTKHFILTTIAAAVLAGAMGAQATRDPELERMSMLVGTFEGEVRYSPPGMTAQTGRMSYQGTWDMDGWLVVSRYDQVLGNNPAINGLLIFR